MGGLALCSAKSLVLLCHFGCIINFKYSNASSFSLRYHRLLKLRYGNKHNKSLAAKEWANTEGLSVREMECHMDVEMFLEGAC